RHDIHRVAHHERLALVTPERPGGERPLDAKSGDVGGRDLVEGAVAGVGVAAGRPAARVLGAMSRRVARAAGGNETEREQTAGKRRMSHPASGAEGSVTD